MAKYLLLRGTPVFLKTGVRCATASWLAPIRQNKNRRHMPQLFGSIYLSAGGSILVSGVGWHRS
jgi:hypothetical protein